MLFHNVTSYTNFIESCIHVNTTKFRNITCTLVAIGVILWSLECMWLEKLIFLVEMTSHSTLETLNQSNYVELLFNMVRS